MLKCFFENKQAINLLLTGEIGEDDYSESENELDDALYSETVEFVDKSESVDSLEFSKNEWKQIEGMLVILKPIYESTLFVERRLTNAGHIIPLLKQIELDLINEPKTSPFPNVRQAIVDGLKKRMKGWEKNDSLTIATILDPLFKASLLPQEHLSQYKDKMINEILRKTSNLTENSILPALQPQQEQHPFAKLMSTVSNIPPEVLDKKAKLLVEIENYLGKPFDASFESSYDFWNDATNIGSFPNLRLLFAKYGSSPASSAESERLFSTVGNILTDRRNRFSAETIRKLAFLHHNILLNSFTF